MQTTTFSNGITVINKIDSKRKVYHLLFVTKKFFSSRLTTLYYFIEYNDGMLDYKQ